MTDEEFIEAHEGRRSKPYKDTRGVWTIGIGHNMEVDPSMSHMPPDGLTDQQIDNLFNADVARFRAQLDVHLPWWRNEDPMIQRALLDMCFEMGMGGLLKFQHALAALKAGDRNAAALEFANSAWDKQVPGRAAQDCALIRGAA